jgi:hypothetical protein
MSRRSRDRIVVLDNVGGTNEAQTYAETAAVVARDGTDRNYEHASIVALDRVILRLLRDELADLIAHPDKLDRLFHQILGETVKQAEVDEWVAYVVDQQPCVSSAYPHSGSHFPGFFIVLEGDEESKTFVGNDVGAKLGNAPGDDADYKGSFFDQTHGIFIYAQNPDAVAMLYYLGKMILLGGSDALTAAGAMDLHLSGGELSPQEAYIPVDMFLRKLTVRLMAPMTVEKLRRQPHASRVRVTGVHASDVVVDGRRGGVHHRPDCDGDE